MTDPYKGLREDRAHDEIHTWEDEADQRRLAREASAARGGSPLHRAWRALTGIFRTEDLSSSDD